MASDEDFLGWIVMWFLIVGVIAAVALPFFKDTSFIQKIQGKFILNEYTRLDSTIETIRDVLVWQEAGGINLIGTHEKGIRGVLVGGPEILGEEVWWDVDFEEVPDGWVLQDDLQLVTVISKTVKVLRASSHVLVFLFLVGTVYTVLRSREVEQEWTERLKIPDDDEFSGGDIKNERWEHVLELVDSNNPSDWRAAVIEADIILDDLTKRMGYDGEGVGERLKQVEKSDFTTIDSAWEAHKVRNRIAHDGSDFILTQREAKRVIDLFKDVFEEFEII